MLGGAAAWPVAARAQQAKLRTIGFLGAAGPAVASHWLAAFVQRLNELGWSEGRNIAFEVRWADGRRDRAVEIATEFEKRPHQPACMQPVGGGQKNQARIPRAYLIRRSAALS